MMYKNKILQYLNMARPEDPLEYIRKVTKDYIRNDIDKKIINCNQCNNCDDSYKTISKGDTNSDLMIIGSHPNINEKGQPYPFEWQPVKEKLTTIYDFYNINDDYIFYMNLVNCLPTINREERVPSLDEVEKCNKYVLQMIEIIKPKAILLLGPAPYNGLKDSEFYNSFNNIMGKWVSVLGIPAIVTYNMYDFEDSQKWVDNEELEEAKSDFVYHFEMVFEKISELSPNTPLLNNKRILL